MKRNVLLELLEDGNMVSLYSPRFEGEAFTELQKIDIQLKRLEKQKILTIKGTSLLGELSFAIEDNEDEEN